MQCNLRNSSVPRKQKINNAQLSTKIAKLERSNKKLKHTNKECKCNHNSNSDDSDSS